VAEGNYNTRFLICHPLYRTAFRKGKKLIHEDCGTSKSFLGYEVLGEEEWKMKFLKKRRWEIVA
jgi:hypothetical protein